MGCHGYSGVMANFHPDLYSKLIKAIEEGDDDKAEFLQNLVGFFSVTECQCYPINAKYYLSLDGLNITYNSRTRNPAEFTETRRLEIEQMYKFTKEIEKKYAL
jgi:4-hydroxy-tetrahydrodipicolinate synthase